MAMGSFCKTFLLGVVGFASQIPTFVLTPFAGVWVDRWNRHRIIIATQALLMLEAACEQTFPFDHDRQALLV